MVYNLGQNIMKHTKIKIHKRLTSFLLGIALVFTFLISSMSVVLAASPSLCAVTFGTNPDVISTCSKAKNLPTNVKQLLSGADDRCFKVAVSSPDPDHPSVIESPCSSPPFDAYKPVERNTTEFSSTTCNNAKASGDECIAKYIGITTRFLAAGVGIVVIIMVIIGGIQYSSAGSEPQKLAAARTKIFNALLALIIFIFLFAILQWLLPGGWL
jgi:hypothetical protein